MTIITDIKYAFRQLRKSPSFTVVAALTLALSIGINTAIFSLLNAVLFRPLPVPDAHQLRILNWIGTDLKFQQLSGGSLSETSTGLKTAGLFDYPTYREFCSHIMEFSDLSAFSRLYNLPVVANNQTFAAHGLIVSGNIFKTLGIQAFKGRTLDFDDDQQTAPPVTVISYYCWRNRFGSDPAVLGQSVTIKKQIFTVVGVLPKGFHGPYAGITPELFAGRTPELYVPLSAQPQFRRSLPLESKEHWGWEIIARLKPNADEKQAQTALTVLFNQSVGEDSVKKLISHGQIVLEDGSRGPLGLRRYYAKSVIPLFAMVVLVLLVACGNLAGLLLVRGVTRQRDLAVRSAIGANRWRLARQSLTESMLLAFIGVGIGLLLAFWGKAFLFRLLWPSLNPVSIGLTLDSRVLAFTLAVTLATVLMFGLLPALRAAFTNPTKALRNRLTPDKSHQYMGKILVTLQVGLSLALVVGASLFVRTLANLTRTDPGYKTENLLVFRLSPFQGGYQDQHLLDYYHNVTTSISAIPGVNSVTLGDIVLLGGGANSGGGLSIADRPGENLRSIKSYVSESFFSTMEIPLLLGRGFAAADNETSPGVIVVNEALAQDFFPGKNPIGSVITMGGRTNVEIVGVCKDIKLESLKHDASPAIFFPYRQHTDRIGSMVVHVRMALPPLSLVPAVRQAVAGVDRSIPMVNITSQSLQLNNSIASERLFASMGSFLALLAMLLSCIGLYGLIAYNVTSRTGEIGIRMALGAQKQDIAWPIIRSALLMTACGMAIGVPMAFIAVRTVRSYLYGIEPYDSVSIFFSVFILLSVTALAAWIPARRAARIDPMEALRYE